MNEKYSIIKCISSYSEINKLKELVYNKSPKISDLMETYTKEEVHIWLENWIKDTNDFFNFSSKMTPAQISKTAFYLRAYQYLNVSEITYIFVCIQQMKFGQMYNSIDGAKILQGFEKYTEKRNEFIKGYESKLRSERIQFEIEKNKGITLEEAIKLIPELQDFKKWFNSPKLKSRRND